MKLLTRLATLLFFVVTPTCFAQVTVVTGTVKDTNGVPYAGASIKAQLVLAGAAVNGQPTVTVTGVQACRSSGFGSSPCQVPFQGTTGPFTLDSTGSFSQSLQDNALVTPASTQWLFSVTISPGVPPPLGTGPQACSATLTITGATQSITSNFSSCPALSTFSISPSTGIKGTNIFSPLDYGAKFNLQYAFSVSCTNASTLITSGAGDPSFKAADVGLVAAGNAAGLNGVANCPPQGTITSVVDAHNVNISNVPVNPSPNTNSQFGWGTNDGAAIAAAFAASIGKGCVILPSGNAFFDVPPFINTAAVTGEPACIIGQHTTNLTPLPSFNVSSCYVTQTACFYYSNNGLQTEPNFSILRDFEFFGMGWNLTGNFTNYTLVNSNRVTSMNFWIWNIGTSPDSGIRFQGPNYYHAFTAYNTGGVTGCEVIGVGGSSAGLNQMTTMEQSYCKGGQHSVTVGTNASIRTFGGQFDSPGGGRIAQAETITNDGIFDSYGEGSFIGASGTSSIRTTANGTSYLRGTWVIGQSANTNGAVGCSASGGRVILVGSTIDGGGGGGFTLKNVAGCIINSLGGNTFLNGPSMSLAGPFIADGHSLKGACTGVATASQTLGLYGTGSNVTVATCTSTTIGLGVPLQGARTLQALTVTATAAGTNASSGVVTVLKNGVATTITCTIGTGTSCTDGTHSAAFADGDLASIQFTTQAADTLAGVKAFVEWE